MTTIRANSKKAVLGICPKISNKISTKEALSVVETTKQNVLEAFSLPNNCDKLLLTATEATSSSLAGFSLVKVLLKRHTWISFSIVSTLTKNLKVFNNRPVNKLVFSSMASTSSVASTSSSKKMVKKTKSSEKWEQSLASAIVIPNFFVVSNEILDKIFVVSSGMSFKMGQDQPLAVLPNVVSFGRSLPVLKAKQSLFVGLSVLENWTNQLKTKSSPPLVFGAISSSAWETIINCQRFARWVASALVPGATFKIKLAYIKAVFQSVHGFLNAKSVLKDNIKLFCVEFAFQVSLKAVFLVELTSSIYLATLKIAKSLVVSESGLSSTTVALCNVLLDVFAVDIKMALSVFGSVIHVVLKSPFLLLFVFSPVVVGNPLVLSYLFSLKSDLTKLSALVESIVKPISSLVTAFEQFINSDLVLSSAFDLRINEVLVHMSSFSRTVNKLEREVVSLKKKCCMEDIDMFGDSGPPPVVNDKVFSNLMFLWKHESVDVKTDPFKTAE
ncbi:hypothetical protein G9A89_011620 [Geosiphon pyriformis]|nr:hypothetical protein G9A89_011620 [Geosiphon pyriformis]